MKSVFEKIHKAVLCFMVCSTPLVLSYVHWFMGPDGVPPAGLFHRTFNAMCGLWVLCACYLVLALIFYKEFREGLMAKLAGFRERDEREQLATSDASRSTFLLMLGVQIVFLLMSFTTFEVVQKPDGHGFFKLGISIGREQADLFSPDPVPALLVVSRPEGTVTTVHLLPPNMGAVLLLLIFVQLLGFRLFAGRRYKGLS